MLPERFWRKVDKSGAGGCWLWTASLHDGYGQIHFNGKMWQTHRLAYDQLVERLPNDNLPAGGLSIDGTLVIHSCDVRNCVNPSHLRTGTAKDNTGDRVRRKRSAPTDGERNGNAKLTRHDVLQIRALRGTMLQRQLADKFGVTREHIDRIQRRKLWAHLRGED